MKTKKNIDSNKPLTSFVKKFGPDGINLRILSEILDLKISQKHQEIFFYDASKETIFLANNVVKALEILTDQGFFPKPWDIEWLVDLLKENNNTLELHELIRPSFTTQLGNVYAKNISQRSYIDLIAKNDLVFALGAAGTGKTYLAVAAAVDMLIKGEVDKIILARPAVEAGENLGFLPGDLSDKLNPYLRPLYDALESLLPYERCNYFFETRKIEIAPLAFMRGRTLSRSFIILDEAQNATKEQMKMFLTRIGHGSKAVVTGDESQSDLPSKIQSGLSEAVRILVNIEGIAFCRFSTSGVIRHRLVKKIIEAYQKNGL